MPLCLIQPDSQVYQCLDCRSDQRVAMPFPGSQCSETCLALLRNSQDYVHGAGMTPSFLTSVWQLRCMVTDRGLGSCLLYRHGHSGETTPSLLPSSPSSLLPLSYRKCVGRALPTGDDASAPGSISHKPQAFVLVLFPICSI